jgi:hypothetical protein
MPRNQSLARAEISMMLTPATRKKSGAKAPSLQTHREECQRRSPTGSGQAGMAVPQKRRESSSLTKNVSDGAEVSLRRLTLRLGRDKFRDAATNGGASRAQARPLKLKRTRSKPSRRARHAVPLPGARHGGHVRLQNKESQKRTEGLTHRTGPASKCVLFICIRV